MKGQFKISAELLQKHPDLEEILRELPLEATYSDLKKDPVQKELWYGVENILSDKFVRIQPLYTPYFIFNGLFPDHNEKLDYEQISFFRFVTFNYRNIKFYFDMVSGTHPDFLEKKHQKP